mgnify:CR=1 FL=1
MKALRYIIPIGLLAALVGFILFPTQEERIERFQKRAEEVEMDVRVAFQDVTRLVVRESAPGGYKTIELQSHDEIRGFMNTIDLSTRGPGCTCMYIRYADISTPSGEYEMTIGPHHFWIREKGARYRTPLYVTPSELFAEFESKFGRTVKTENAPNKPEIASLIPLPVD